MIGENLVNRVLWTACMLYSVILVPKRTKKVWSFVDLLHCRFAKHGTKVAELRNWVHRQNLTRSVVNKYYKSLDYALSKSSVLSVFGLRTFAVITTHWVQIWSQYTHTYMWHVPNVTKVLIVANYSVGSWHFLRLTTRMQSTSIIIMHIMSTKIQGNV